MPTQSGGHEIPDPRDREKRIQDQLRRGPYAPPPEKTVTQQFRQMHAALYEIREKAATMPNGGAWAAGIAALCLGTLK